MTGKRDRIIRAQLERAILEWCATTAVRTTRFTASNNARVVEWNT
jgi:hypothetical protein